jgi:hypothetical protein
MVNYRCTAACRHCLYACSPTREAGYITPETMRDVCRLLRVGACRSVHIGGGEPFLSIEGLIMVVRELRSAGIRVEYVETNGFWSAADQARDILKQLMLEGVDTLCVSLDPFHAEYLAYGFPLRLTRLCGEVGMHYFLWKEQYLSSLMRLSSHEKHSRAKMEAQLSPTYIRDTARSYGVTFGGRAVAIEQEYGNSFPYNELVDDTPCRDLLSTGHFHVDMHGYFIPPGCTGLRLPLAEVVSNIQDGKYPAFEALYQGGVAALLRLARERGVEPDEAGYTSKCNLCFHIRHALAWQGFAELDAEHYAEALKYYGA